MSAVLHPDSERSGERQAALRAAFDRLSAAFEAERDPSLATRLDRLRRLDAMVARMAPEAVQAIAADFGHRPEAVTRLADIIPVQLASRHARKHLAGWMKTRRMPTGLIHRPGYNRLMRQPLGVVGVVSPWNYPLLLALGPAVAALAAGNRVMLKPSEISPRFAELLHTQVAQSFSADEFTVVTGDAQLAQAFVSLPFLVIALEGAARTAGRDYEVVAATLGAPPNTVWWRVTVPLLLPGLLSGAVLAFARSLGEFGATLTFAGSREGVTRTLPLEIYLQRESDADAAVALSMLLVAVAALVVVGLGARRLGGSGAG